ncbi:putative DeoR-family transcriptional regulator [Anaeromyxobacter dehalogenans 2CP-1]|uniref:DeoR-family transcriptional regulator n=1 Tax=Anaeromyxobacter dehalogenans (strain ATCC BAA-258 / DSM 21875 / 2CP-1) TaxID=455488 RepID=B8JC42_ANAD2|nr:WYL domain-containing protein [Anaeromyxobacter dehalogenans]ACL63964.1 putative DeoR-family transcriptional regulator [Anaeromyxobacter dehalogenans 2CP-1]
MQKDQRLLDLAALLLKAAEPVSWREIQEQFPEDYGGKGEAAIRKFERDKADLLELGIPVRYASGDEDLPAGYLIDRDEFYLPDLKLPPEDLALLYLAGSAALATGTFPYARDLAHALNKLSFAARAPGASEAAAFAARRLGEGDGPGPAVGPIVEELSRAIALKKRVHLAYLGAERREQTERDVDPYGLFQRGGAWFLVGWCHLRRDLRTFHVSRIESLTVNPSARRTPDFQPRKDFSLADHATREAWEYSVHAPVRCKVRLEPPVSAEVLASFGARARVREDGAATLVEVDATNGEGLLRHVLALGDGAELLAPKALRDRARAVLEQLAEELA